MDAMTTPRHTPAGRSFVVPSLLTRVKALEWDLVALLAVEPVPGENTGVPE